MRGRLIVEYKLLQIEVYIMYIIFAVVLMKFNNGESDNTQKSIFAISFLSALATVFDILCIFNYGNYITHLLVVFKYTVLSFSGLLWFKYCIKEFNINSKFLNILAYLPMIFTLTASVISVKTGWVYSIDENNNITGGSGFYCLLINYIYVLTGILCGVYALKKAASIRKGKEALIISLCATPVLLSGIQIVLYPEGLNIVTYSILISLFILYGIQQKKKTVTDNLTELPNRYGMEDEIAEQLRQYKKDKDDSFYVIVCDLDNFKKINDSWGHAEGDRALILIADALEKIALKYDSEVFRIGGDEFVIITNTSESGLADIVCSETKDALDEIDFREDFDICMSMGVALYDGKTPIDELIKGADKKLYQAKKNKKNNNV